MKVWVFSYFQKQVKSDIENFKWLFQIEDQGGIEGTCICVQQFALKKRIIKLLSHCVIMCCFRKGKNTKTLVISSELYVVFWSIYSIQATEKNLYSFTVDHGSRVGYQAWQEFWDVRLKLVCHKCLGHCNGPFWARWMVFAPRWLNRLICRVYQFHHVYLLLVHWHDFLVNWLQL